MVNQRPTHLDLTGTKYGEQQAGTRRSPMTSPGDLAPPRAGEVPPALSPLDAFAMQSRLLAKRFEVVDQSNGKRISRLPPLTVQHEFANRPGFFRSASSEESSAAPDESPIDGDDSNTRTVNEVEERWRPKSHYPSLEGGPAGNTNSLAMPPLPGIGEEQESWTPQQETARRTESYFAIPRADSPDVVETTVTRPTPTTPHTRRPPSAHKLSVDSLSISSPQQSLRPPRSPLTASAMKTSPSLRSAYDSSDDVDALSMGESVDSLPPQKPSTNSSYSRSHSPQVPFQFPAPRSPSVASESSWASAARPSFNFSRPMSAMSRPSLDQRAAAEVLLPPRQNTMDSNSSRPSLEVPSRQGTGDGPLTPMSIDAPKTPITVASEDYFTADSDNNGGQPYTYTKYSLPRGRAVNRESMAPGDFILKQFEWGNGDADSLGLSRTPSPPPVARPVLEHYPLTPPHLDPNVALPFQRSVSSDAARDIVLSGTASAPKQPMHKPSNSNPTSMTTPSRPSVLTSTTSVAATSSSGGSTIRAKLDPSSRQAPPPQAAATSEHHLQLGITLHEAGKLQESTYHFRIAAKAGHPTAMLLYALACRHGWGMKPSQAEGVVWLQRAVDSAQLEVAEDEDLVARSPIDVSQDPARAAERKTHKAQFALSVYELGMSYMNGWGVRQDRALGLRCFEVAGNWGDADALAEAAFCYAEGVGAKKDLKRAARLYREAEAKGMSMAGNSWIYKSKYMDARPSSRAESGRASSRANYRDVPAGATTPDGKAAKKPRDKSRTRTIFGRKKAPAVSTPPA